jgi:UDP-N-acetylmuramate: L-alanyl-gamma-D-glutamyl-meso-diaminopimelate ligase
LYILGICGTFMGGVAALARALGHEVAGCDANIYPPMSDQLAALGVHLDSGYRAEHLDAARPDLVIVGNALSRGNPIVERLLDSRLAYISGPQWIGENVLASHRVFAVAGTHGKTTTTAMLAWILQACGQSPGFLVGGVPENFGVSARLGKRGQGRFSASRADGADIRPREIAADPFFVIEADEYDTAFFDKRSKFVHYRPTVAVLNNLEYDHADIFPDVAAIQRQFHHLVRIVPGHGQLVVNAEDARLAEVLAMGAWTPATSFGIDAGDWRARLLAPDGSRFAVSRDGGELGQVHWNLLGRHNVMNALAALAAAHAGGVDAVRAIAALAEFRSAKRRLEFIGAHAGINVYDDFAHHPTAIATTLAGLRAHAGAARILVGMEPRSNSMRLGAHADELAPSLCDADAVVFLRRPELAWDAQRVTDALGGRGQTAPTVDALIAALRAQARAGDLVVFMSNGAFDNAPRRFLQSLR